MALTTIPQAVTAAQRYCQMTFEEYSQFQEKRKAKGNVQPQIIVTQDTNGNVVVTITLPPP